MIKNRIIDLKRYCFRKIKENLLHIEKYDLVCSLKSYGQNLFVQMPINITNPSKIEFGNDVSIAAYVHMWGDGGIKIGDRVMIGSHAAITSLTHDYEAIDMKRSLKKAEVRIDDDAWIGSHSIILPGVSVGKGAVVGAGSVVTKNVLPYSIVFGCPAKHFKFRNINKENASKSS